MKQRLLLLSLVTSQRVKVCPYGWRHYILGSMAWEIWVGPELEASSLGPNFHSNRKCHVHIQGTTMLAELQMVKTTHEYPDVNKKPIKELDHRSFMLRCRYKPDYILPMSSKLEWGWIKKQSTDLCNGRWCWGCGTVMPSVFSQINNKRQQKVGQKDVENAQFGEQRSISGFTHCGLAMYQPFILESIIFSFSLSWVKMMNILWQVHPELYNPELQYNWRGQSSWSFWQESL